MLCRFLNSHRPFRTESSTQALPHRSFLHRLLHADPSTQILPYTDTTTHCYCVSRPPGLRPRTSRPSLPRDTHAGMCIVFAVPNAAGIHCSCTPRPSPLAPRPSPLAPSPLGHKRWEVCLSARSHQQAPLTTKESVYRLFYRSSGSSKQDASTKETKGRRHDPHNAVQHQPRASQIQG